MHDYLPRGGCHHAKLEDFNHKLTCFKAGDHAHQNWDTAARRFGYSLVTSIASQKPRVPICTCFLSDIRLSQIRLRDRAVFLRSFGEFTYTRWSTVRAVVVLRHYLRRRIRANWPGPNVDPNVFSDLVPWFHSFCEISSSDAKHHVIPSTLGLSMLAAPGDIVFYGGAVSSPHELFVNTVLCVGYLVSLPQSDGKFRIRECVRELLSEMQLDVSVDAFYESYTYRLCLRDAERDGCHPGTRLVPHRTLIGRRLETKQDGLNSSTLLLELFESGSGLNFIPVRRLPSRSEGVPCHPGLFVTEFRDAKTMLNAKSVVLPQPRRGHSYLPYLAQATCSYWTPCRLHALERHLQ